MSFPIERGLAQFDHLDHHAILGIPLDATAAEIRKRYLTIVRILHPDSRGKEGDRQQANQLLSKLVNPAYEVLSQEKQRTEYEVLLRLLGQRLGEVKSQLVVRDPAVQQLLQAANPHEFYREAVQKLADRQYQSLDQVMELINQLSELNMVYLLRRETNSKVVAVEMPTSTAGAAVPAQPSGAPSSPVAAASAVPRERTTPAPGESFVDQYYRRAEEFLAKNNFQPAILELRDALKLEPQNSRCHSLMGMVYLKQKTEHNGQGFFYSSPEV